MPPPPHRLCRNVPARRPREPLRHALRPEADQNRAPPSGWTPSHQPRSYQPSYGGTGAVTEIATSFKACMLRWAPAGSTHRMMAEAIDPFPKARAGQLEHHVRGLMATFRRDVEAGQVELVWRVLDHPQQPLVVNRVVALDQAAGRDVYSAGGSSHQRTRRRRSAAPRRRNDYCPSP